MRNGAASASEIVDRSLARAEATTDLNAFTRLDPDAARRRASGIDARVAASDDPGPLAGVPIALKDLIDQEGIATTAGSSFLRDPAAKNATVVDRLERAGAVIVGRTGLHEFAYGFSSENEWWGPVRNPWDPATSPGGSSGGSASAVAAGVAPIGIGTDTGGSVRVPAALCGLVGLKVTHGRIPLSGVFPLAASVDTVGPMTTTIEDAALAYRVMAGHDPGDSWSRDHAIDEIVEEGAAGLRIGIPHPWLDRPIEPAISATFDATADALRTAGSHVEDFDESAIDERQLPPGAYAEVADVHRGWFDEDASRYGSLIRSRLGPVMDLTNTDIDEAKRWRAALRGGFDRAFERFDLLLTPGTAGRSKVIGSDTMDVGAGPEPYRPVLSWFTPLVNQAGLPALTIPIESTEASRPPPAIQLVGPAWSESRLLSIGMALDSLGLVSHRRPPAIEPIA